MYSTVDDVIFLSISDSVDLMDEGGAEGVMGGWVCGGGFLVGVEGLGTGVPCFFLFDGDGWLLSGPGVTRPAVGG